MHLPGYDILEELGRGGMGIVYKARQVHLNRLVALKTILAGAHAGPEDLARFRIEAKAAARLDHPNIIRIYDFSEHQGLPYFSMELVLGGSLARKISGQPWPITAAAHLVQTLALAIHQAHQQHIIHRDLKPANVLFQRDGTPKITDFGLAKQLDGSADLTRTGQLLGTARYMAPEQAAGDSRGIGPATDVHALGLILYELLTGRPAFKGTTLLETLEQVRSGNPAPPAQVRPGIPGELGAVCLRCLQKDPRRRFGTAKELADQLQNVAAGTAGQGSLPPSVSPEPDADGLDRDQWWRA
jgi:serine/threonine protein kinase